MQIYQHQIEAFLQDLLQRQLQVTLNKRVTKTGKLILYRIKGHIIELVFDVNDIYKLAYPFVSSYDANARILNFNYSLNRLFTSPSVVYSRAIEYASKFTSNRLLNNTVIIEEI